MEDYEEGYFERGRHVGMVFDRRAPETTEEEEPRRTKPCVSSPSGIRISSRYVGRVRRMDVTERRRLCSVLRTVFTNLGAVGVLRGLTELFSESKEVVVM